MASTIFPKGAVGVSTMINFAVEIETKKLGRPLTSQEMEQLVRDFKDGEVILQRDHLTDAVQMIRRPAPQPASFGGKTASQVWIDEAATLAAMPNNLIDKATAAFSRNMANTIANSAQSSIVPAAPPRELHSVSALLESMIDLNIAKRKALFKTTQIPADSTMLRALFAQHCVMRFNIGFDIEAADLFDFLDNEADILFISDAQWNTLGPVARDIGRKARFSAVSDMSTLTTMLPLARRVLTYKSAQPLPAGFTSSQMATMLTSEFIVIQNV